MAILNNTTATVPADALAAALARIAELEAAANKPRAMSFKVTEKGGLSVYGLGRFPVTLYRGQWERLLGAKAELEAFIAANAAALSVKS